MANSTSRRTLFTKLLSAAVCAALILTSPGPFAIGAFAAVIGTGKVVAAPQAPAVPIIPALRGKIGGNSLSLSNPLANSLPSISRVQAPTLNQQAALSAVSVNAGVPGGAARVNAVSMAKLRRGASPAADLSIPKASIISSVGAEKNDAGGRRAAKPSVRRSLAASVRTIRRAADPAGRFAALKSLFTNSRKRGGLSVLAADNAVPAAASASFGLTKLTLGDLEAAAINSFKNPNERAAAVAAIAKQGGDAAKTALGRVADANPAGGAADYEIHRAALRALVESYGELRSLRPVSAAHEAELLAELETKKPEALISDYDDTLAEFRRPISAELGAAFAAVADAGVEPMILTDRSDVKRFDKDVAILDSLEALSNAQKSKIAVISSKGTKTTIYDRRGNPYTLQTEKIAWTETERTAISEASKAVEARFGRQEYPAESGQYDNLSDHAYARFLPLGLAPADVQAAAELMQKELTARAVTNYEVVGRTPAKPENPSYISLAKTDKSIGVLRFRGNQRIVEQIRDVLRLRLPHKLVGLAKKFYDKLPSRPVAGKDIVLIGDQFMGQGAGKGTDEFMIKGAPGARAFAVGGLADPRHDNLFVMREKGSAAALKVLRALGKRAAGDVDKKAVIGMFAQRTVSITAFVLTTIAFTAIAVPAIGWGGYGALMALGSLAPIATGPFNGWLVDKFSARTTMTVNTWLRVGLLLALPLLSSFGMLNFASLLFASVANYWLLSAVMTTENSYVKRFAGQKHIGAIMGGLWMNYLVIQVVGALILGMGALVGIWGAINTFYAAAAVNALVVFPIIWFTMPKKSPNITIPRMEARLRKIDALRAQAADAKLTAEAEALKAAISAREIELRTLIKENGQANDKTVTEIQALEAAAPQGLSGLLKRLLLRAQVKALEAENSHRADAAAAARMEIDRATAPVLSRRERYYNPREGAAALIKKHWPSAAALAASIGVYLFLWNSAVPIAASLLFAISRTTGYKMLAAGRGREVGEEEAALVDRLEANDAALKSAPAGDKRAALLAENKNLRAELTRWKTAPLKSMLLLAATALLLYPLQYFGVPKFTEAVTGLPMSSPESTMLYGRYLGALFFGNMVATAASARMPEIRVPLVGRIPMQRLLQVGVVALAAVWSLTSLMPGSIPAALSAAAAAAGLMFGAKKLTNRAWIKFSGLGFAAIWLPYLMWGSAYLPVATLMYLSLLTAGLFYGPSYISLVSYFQGSFKKSVQGMMIGVQGSFFNGAISIGIGLAVTAFSMLSPVFPTLLAVFGVAFALIGLALWFAPKRLPGLPKTLLHPKEKKG